MELRIEKIRDVRTPEKANPGDAGIDFFVPNDMPWESVTIPPGGMLLIPAGVKVNVPYGWALIAFEKSGVATKMGLMCGARVVDYGYSGEVHIHLFNPTKDPVTVKAGQKMIQFLLLPVPSVNIRLVDKIFNQEGSRGDGGFGSSGL